ncbi:Crp/Fnr family transcriptional regulator [Isobaculum melis]|nr:Crp/Fnr family transcriptional regulator [Isobaculum melis]
MNQQKNKVFFETILAKKLNLTKTFYKKGTLLPMQDGLEPFVMILDGFVIQTAPDTVSGSKALTFLTKYEFTGLASLYNDFYFPNEYVALTDITVVHLTPQMITQNIADYPLFLYTNLQCEILVYSLNLVGTSLSGSERIIFTLVELAKQIPQENDSSQMLIPSFITQKTIASFSSVSRVYVTRVLTDLEKKGIIHRVEKKGIAIPNLEQLILLSPPHHEAIF